MRESRVEAMLVRAVKKAGGVCWKLPANLYRGIPDRMVLLPGARVYFVEVKADTGRVSPHQTRLVKFLHQLGFHSYIITGPIQMQEFIHDHIEIRSL